MLFVNIFKLYLKQIVEHFINKQFMIQYEVLYQYVNIDYDLQRESAFVIQFFLSHFTIV